MTSHKNMSTPNPCHKYTFSWKIGNFSHTPLDFDGPSFSPIPDKKGKFYFQVKFLEKMPSYNKSRIRVYLETLDDFDGHICVKSAISLCDSDKIERYARTTDVLSIDSSTLLLDIVIYVGTKKDFGGYFGSLDDVLIVDGTLSFLAYDTSSNRVVEPIPEVFDELVNNLRNMYLSGLSSDVTLTVGDSSLSAHKAILSSRSPVFAKMFDQDMQEKNSNNVVIEDAELHVFNNFLMFLYTGVLEDKTWDTVFALYTIADKYQVKSLRKVCSEILGTNLTADSIWRALLLLDLHEDDKLIRKVNEFIANNWEIFGTKEWAEVVIAKPQLVEDVMRFVKWYSSLRYVTL